MQAHAHATGTVTTQPHAGTLHIAFIALPAFKADADRQLPGQALFQYQEEGGQLRSVSSTDVNDYLAEAVQGERCTAKNFRIWHGTVQALELTRLACEPGRTAADGSRYSAREILAAVAKQLGSALAGDSEDASAELLRKMSARTVARRTRGLHAAEQRLLAFLRGASAKPGARTARGTQGGQEKSSLKAAPHNRRDAGQRSPQPGASEKRTLSRSSATM